VLDNFTAMKPVVVNPTITFSQLIQELESTEGDPLSPSSSPTPAFLRDPGNDLPALTTVLLFRREGGGWLGLNRKFADELDGGAAAISAPGVGDVNRDPQPSAQCGQGPGVAGQAGGMPRPAARRSRLSQAIPLRLKQPCHRGHDARPTSCLSPDDSHRARG